MTHVEIVEAEFLHIRAICERMREREKANFVILGTDPEPLLIRELSRSFLSYAGLVDGEVVAVWGAKTAGVIGDEAYLWMVCADTLGEHRITFLRHAKEALDMFRPLFKCLYGLVAADHHASVKWLTWLGFTIDPVKDKVRLFWLGQRPEVN